MISVYKKNLISMFVKNILLVTVFFFCLTLVMNVLEEITFFKNMSVTFTLPLLLTFLILFQSYLKFFHLFF